MGPDSLLAGVGALMLVDAKWQLSQQESSMDLDLGPIFQEEVIGWILDRYEFHFSFI